MNKILRLVLVMLLVLLVFSAPAKPVKAQSTILVVAEDLVLDGAEDWINLNMNGEMLYVDYTYLEMNGTYNWACKIFLKFNLAGITEPFGPATQVRLPLYYASVNAPFNVGLYSISDNWQETTLTPIFANNPANGLGDIALLDTAPAPQMPTPGPYLVFEGEALADYLNQQAAGDKIASFSIHFYNTPSTIMADMVSFYDKENQPANPPVIEAFGPTASALTDFDIEAENDALALNWQSGTEIDLAGFNLYRASTPAGQRVRLNNDLIPAQYPGMAEGGAYQYVDRQVQVGKYYYYWLEMVAADGTVVLNGPFGQLLPRRYYLPLVGFGFR